MMSCWHCSVANPGFRPRQGSGETSPTRFTRRRDAGRTACVVGALAVVGTLLGLAGAASAHHSATMFEQTKTITVEGVVKEFQWTNPHSWLLVDVTDANGKVVTWGFEAEGPSTLQRAGIRPSEFKPGTKLTITGRPMKDGRPAAIWVDAVREDGKRFDPREGFRVK